MTNKKKWLIAVGVLLACVLAVVLSMPRFYRGDRIKLDISITGADAEELGFSVQSPTGQPDECTVDINGDTAAVSAKADEYGRYSVMIDGADKPVELRINKSDWFQRTEAEITLDMENGCAYSADVLATNGELPLRRNSQTEGCAEEKDGRYVIYIYNGV